MIKGGRGKKEEAKGRVEQEGEGRKRRREENRKRRREQGKKRTRNGEELRKKDVARKGGRESPSWGREEEKERHP